MTDASPPPRRRRRRPRRAGAPEQVQPGATKAATPAGASPTDTSPDGTTGAGPVGGAPSGVTSSEAIPSGVTSSEASPSGATSSEASPDGATRDGGSSSGNAPTARERPARAGRPAAATPRRRRANPRDGQPVKDTDRGWRELLGNAPSQVGIGGAMRARDVARPDAAELAAAERDLTIVRRQWKPPEEPGR